VFQTDLSLFSYRSSHPSSKNWQ